VAERRQRASRAALNWRYHEPSRGERNVVRITDETFPILCFQNWGKSTKADIDFIRPFYERSLRRGKIIALSDARYANHDAEQRKLWANWLAEVIRIDVHAHSVATVVLLDSVLLRGALVALNWITPPRAPQHVVGSDEDALEECRVLVDKHGLHVPAHVWGQVRLWLSESNQHRALR
jgi:hypothetical protein